jgi:hypothetical protein
VSRASAAAGATESSRSRRAEALLYKLTLVLCFSLPFEPIRPLLALGWVDLNHLKAAPACTLVVWVAGRGNWAGLLQFAAGAGRLPAASTTADRRARASGPIQLASRSRPDPRGLCQRDSAVIETDR